MKLTAGKLWGLRRLADESGRFKMVAVDQRPPIKQLVASARGTSDAADDDVRTVKRLLVEELASNATALLLDPHYAYPAAIHAVPASKGLLLTLEDSIFADTVEGRRSSEISDWSVEKIKRTGADAVKLLAWYRPDTSPGVRHDQQAFVARVGDACWRYDIPFVLELLTYPLQPDTGITTADAADARTAHVIDSVAEFSDPNYGIDLFKLESPVLPSDVPDPDGPEAPAVQARFDALDAAAGRPWVMLSAGAAPQAFHRILTFAYRAGASGFLAGRAIWWSALQHFPDVEVARQHLRSDGAPYLRDIGRLTDHLALPFTSHVSFGAEGPVLDGDPLDFRATYTSFGGAS